MPSDVTLIMNDVAVRGLRPLVLLALVGIVVALVGPTADAPARVHNGVTLSSLDQGILQQLNQIRVLHGLVALELSSRLTASAAQHSREMGDRGYFHHASADGTAFWKRVAHWYGPGGVGFWAVGENLLWSSPKLDASEALRRWMASPVHRTNILDPSWRQVGVAAVHFASAPGVYHGLPVTIVTTDFGVRS
jgi:uncharacterized protein YkwD